MRPAKLWRICPSTSRAAARRVLDRRAGRARAGRSRRADRPADQVPAEERDHAAGRQEGEAPGRHGPGVRSAGGAPAGRLPPRAPAADDGRVSRRARHRARRRADHRGSAEGAGRRRRSTRPPRRWPPSFPRPTSRATSGRCSGRIPRPGAACKDRPELADDRLRPRRCPHSNKHIFICCNHREPAIRAAAAIRRATRRCRRRSRRRSPSAA